MNRSTVTIEVPVPGSNRRFGFTRRLEAFFVAQRDRLVWLHGSFFIGFLVLVLLPLWLPEPLESDTALTHFTPLANFLLWGVWFPLVFLSVIFTGRSWCGLMCPMGAASEWAGKQGLKRPIPGWLRWQGTPLLSFVVITILGQTLGVRDHPEAVAEIFGGTLLLAIVIGWFYGRSKRAWCRHMCPIGLLLGVFSRLGAVQFRPKRPRPGGDRHTEKTLCPTFIDLNRKQESRHCIECFRCVHPESRGGLELRLRRPGEEIEQIDRHHANGWEVFFLFAASGLALGGFLWLVLPEYTQLRQQIGGWFLQQGWQGVLQPGPSWLMSVHPAGREVFLWLDFLCITGFMLAVMLASLLTLGASTWLCSHLAGLLGAEGEGRRRFIELGYQFAPVAMVSLVVGLGSELFSALGALADPLRISLFALGLAWSLWLGLAILRRQGVAGWRLLPPLLPGALGSLLLALGWWPAIV